MDDPEAGAGELLLPTDVSLPEHCPGFVTISLFTRPAIRHNLHDERLRPVSPSSRSRGLPGHRRFRRFQRPGLTAGAVT
ncbi:hypothetical protein ACFYN3_01290 [Streptomyces lavendulae]|uniref:hypothetical protein n=1 Tax=Streptomyces lavendulae TaxID=1914 RepID=UPI0036A2B465